MTTCIKLYLPMAVILDFRNSKTIFWSFIH